jgi:hypothetical protein
MRTWIAPVAWLCASMALAEEIAAPAPAALRIDLDSVAALVATVASCAALHAAAADVLERERLPDHAAVARRRAHVDQLTAMYLLAEDRVAKGAARQDLTTFTSSVEQLTAAARVRMSAVVANENPTAFRREEDVCESLVPLEDEVLTKLAAE